MTPQEFHKRVRGWIQNERNFLPPQDGLDIVLGRIEFNVMDAFADYIWPEMCPDCTRDGKSHDGECEIGDEKIERDYQERAKIGA